MRRILLCWELGAGLGHLIPLRAIAERMTRRGHAVSLVTCDVETAKFVFKGIRGEIFPAPRMAPKPCCRGASVFAHVLLNNGFDDIGGLQNRCDAWSDIFDVVRPSLAVFDHCPTGMLAARKYSFPKATLGTGFCIPPDQDVLPNWRPWLNESPSDLVNAENIVCKNISRAFDELEPIERIGQLYGEMDCEFLMTYRELDHFPDRAQGTYRGIFADEGGSIPNWPLGHGKRVFAYLKSTTYFERLLEHLCERDCPSLIFAPSVDPVSQMAIEKKCACIRFSNMPLDLNQVMRECDAVLHHGTHGVASSSLLAGSPAILFPTELEQRVTCVNIHQLGAGRMANPLSEDQVCTAMDDVLVHDNCRSAAQKFSKKYENINRKDTLLAVADKIEEYL